MKFKKFEISIPKIINERDYVTFSEYEGFIDELGLKNVSITELGFFDNKFIGVLHNTGDMHQESFQMMQKEFEELCISNEPFDADEILAKYYDKGCK